MTNQELFDTVSVHLLTQNAKSLAPIPDGPSMCAYRGGHNTRCAIGCLIPDDRYTPTLEGITASNPKVYTVAGLEKAQVDLARQLQRVHDSYPVEQWETKLHEVAADEHLSTDAMDALIAARKAQP